MGIMIGLSFISFIFAYLSVNISKKHGPLQIFFIILCFISMVLNVSVASVMASDAAATEVQNLLNAGGIRLTVWSLVFVVFYFIIHFIYKVLMKSSGKEEEELSFG